MTTGSPRYGHRAEVAAIERHDLARPEQGADAWHDAETQDGQPVEIKAAMRERRDGSEGRFRLFRQPHRRLSSRDGLYVFVVYRARGSGVEVLATDTVEARALRVDSWTRAGHETDGREYQRRIPVSEVFGA